jgi:hypothetical protein
MPDGQGRARAARRLDEAIFEAALLRVVEQIVESPADDTAGARVVARLQAMPPRWHLPPLWLAPAAAAVLVAMVVIGRGGVPADSARTAREAATSVAAQASDTSPQAPAGTADAPDTTHEPVLLIGSAASSVRGSAGRRRARARTPTPIADDASTVPLLEVTGALLIDGTADAAGTDSDMTPLPVDALALETLDAPGLEPRRDD